MRAHRGPAAIHAVAATALIIVQLGTIVPGLLASLTLAGVVAAIMVVPLLALSLIIAALVLPPLGLWRLIRERSR